MGSIDRVAYEAMDIERRMRRHIASGSAAFDKTGRQLPSGCQGGAIDAMRCLTG